MEAPLLLSTLDPSFRVSDASLASTTFEYHFHMGKWVLSIKYTPMPNDTEVKKVLSNGGVGSVVLIA
jgi:hypothetical protein